ncbi:hypothetical protein CBER1_01163 [Cercospora berteroae]|uniref:mRNA export factor GLE1 n=1 Tax=Cercospora berteroae TaxID=357750 RepID=A0A2S6CIW2_9PEZI|nr:hypothetical protein CBER1_01163 [Cercospora berteroae]
MTPYRSADRSRSSTSLLRASPSTRSDHHSSHESQSLQLVEDLSRLLSDDDRTFKRKLDEETLLQQQRHVEALEKALQQHEAVRRSAEHTFEAVQLELERQRITREAAQARRLAEERRKLEEAKQAELRRVEEARQEEETHRKEQERLLQEQQLAKKRREEEESQARAREKAEEQKRIEAQRKATEEAVAREAQVKRQEQLDQQRAQQVAEAANRQQPPGTAQLTVPSGLGTPQAERYEVHNAYLKLHAQCKELRKEVSLIKTSNRQLYDSIRDNARHIKLAVGQLAKNDSIGNRKRINTIQEHWKWSITCCPSETADLNLYRLQPVDPLQVPKVFLYMVNYTVKIILKQLAYEATVDAEHAEPIGILTATLFSKPEFKPGGHFMSDMLWAKFHKIHAALFGVRFNELTPDGRLALGFKRDVYTSKTMWHDAVRALSRGYAAITLRDFSRSQNENPFPNRLYWEALSRVLTTPVEERISLHYVTVDGMLDPLFVPRFIKFYGNNALAAMRAAVLEFPKPPHREGHELAKTTLQKLSVKYQEQLNLRL